MTTFIRLVETSVEEKPAALRETVRGISTPGNQLEMGSALERQTASFADVPGSPFAYWVSDRVRGVFKRLPRLDATYLAVRGAYTTDDFRYYRLGWEISEHGGARSRQETSQGRPYVPIAKGGAFSPIYSDVHLVVRWHNDGADAKAFLAAYRERKGWGTDWSACLNGHSHYFRPGLTWPRRTQGGLGLRAMPQGCIFADKGPAVFVENDDPTAALALLTITTSLPFRFLVELQMAFGSYEVGVIQRTPVPTLTILDRQQLARLARMAWSFKRSLDCADETSHAFGLPAGAAKSDSSQAHIEAHRRSRGAVEQSLVEIQDEMDERVFDLYEIVACDRVTIQSALSRAATLSEDAVETDDSDQDADEADDAPSVPILPVYSWLVGVAFGRFDKRLATGERTAPPEPEPFDPLPSRSPGMWPENEPRPVTPPAILVDDPGHRHDLSAHVTAASDGTGYSVGDDLRPWLAREFFPLHIRMYSKSRRKAPIYWQLATPSASYSVWLYLHAFTRNTLHDVQNDYVVPKVLHEERKLEALRAELGETPRAADRKTLTAQETLVDELRGFLDEVTRVAPLWNPDLDDGVILNFAPLWRLVPHHKPWQKELKATWDSLCDEEYDWAHLAMHLWPERVVPKCATDRSLAIAHGLEEVFWVQGDDEKWKPRKAPTTPVEQLVAERTSAAVKAALKSLMEAPIIGGAAGAARAKRTSKKKAGAS